MKTDFVSFVTHQLRTPLSGVKWMLELAMDSIDSPEDLRGYIQDARMSTDRLIGATGRGVAPDLYVALGISGATQHVSSIRAGTVISVNTDPAATMTRMADLGLVGDLHEVVPALVQAIREYRR